MQVNTPTLPQTPSNTGCTRPPIVRMIRRQRSSSLMLSSTGYFSASVNIFTSADLTYRAVWYVHILLMIRWPSADDDEQVNIPYILWVAAYNTTVLLCYFLLDLAFFPTPLSKSTYSPVSGLKVVRHPNINDSDSDSTHTPTSISSSGSFHRVNMSGLSPGMTMTAGPSPMPAPPLLEAINRNSLAVFLLVRLGPILSKRMLIYVGCSCRLGHCRRT